MQYGMTMVALGEWPAGWAEMEHREFEPGVNVHTDPVEAPRWDGRASIAGKTVLIMHEQGLGDSIMGVRFARDLAARGARVQMRTPPHLVGLLSQAPGVEGCSAVGSPLPPHDFYVPLMSLPACLALEPSHLNGEPYLIPQGECPAPIAALLPKDGTPTVALSWQGNPRHSNDRRRSISGELLAPVFDLPSVRVVALHTGQAPSASSWITRRAPAAPAGAPPPPPDDRRPHSWPHPSPKTRRTHARFSSISSHSVVASLPDTNPHPAGSRTSFPSQKSARIATMKSAPPG
jgi:hypothetical protein